MSRLLPSAIVSSTAAAPQNDGSGADPAPPVTRRRRIGLRANATAAVILAALLVTLAFTTSGGFSAVASAGDTWSEIVIMVLGSAASAATGVLGGRGRAWGAVTVAMFAVLAALTAVSIAWSVQPDYSWQDAGQTVAYLAAFAGAAALARLVPDRWLALVGALATATVALSAYALLVKVFPATLGPSNSLGANNSLGRLQNPFGYWNAIGVTGALGLPPCLWAGARRERGRVARVLAAPAIALLISVLVLSFSRSALLAALLATGLWLALVPLRLRAVVVLAVGAAGAAVIAGWALSTHALTSDGVPLATRTPAGHTFGIVLVLTLAGVSTAGVAASLAVDRIELPSEMRRRIGQALVILIALVPAGGVVALAASSRGLTGEISHAWSTLTSTSGGVGDTSGRIGQLGNSRPLYWSQGIKVGEHALLKGVGAEGYATARQAYATSAAKSDQAHSYVIQTFADFGLIGLAVNLALLVTWGIAAARPLARRARWSSLTGAQTAERQGLLTLAMVVVAFGAQSAIDWTWFFTGVTVPALLGAGWLAGRGPLLSPVGRAAERRPLTQRPGAGAGVIVLSALTLLMAWMTWQPLRSAQAWSASLNAVAGGNTGAAFTDARDAAAIDPMSIAPLQTLSSLYMAVGDRASARAELLEATRRQPGNYNTWLSLGELDMQYHQTRLAFASLLHALRLSPQDPTTIDLVSQARSKLGLPPPKP